MTLESSTIGFICNSLKALSIQFIRQYKIDKFYIDLYIPELFLAIECDELNHNEYDKTKELERTDFIEKNLHCNFIRFNPNDKEFDISNVISQIVEVFINYNKEKNKLYELQVKEKELEFNEKLYNENPELLKNFIDVKKKELQVKENEYEFYSKLMDNPDLFIKFFDSKKQEATNNIATPTPQTTKTTDNIVRNNLVKDCGPLVQVYDGKDLTKILYVFNGITDAVRKMTDATDIKATISYTGIKNAAKKNEIYKGYRWNLISRNELDPKKVFKLEESHIPRTKLERLVAMLNKDKTIVEKVFLQQKEAGEYIQKCASVISIAINHKTMVESQYFILWDMVEKPLQDKYLEQNKLPVLGHKLSGKQIQQIEPKTNKIIKTFFSITDLCNSFKISSKTAKKYAENNEIFKGFLWRFI
jgi:very-short-patch-repair endonuclease